MTETAYRSRITDILDERGVAYRLLPHGGPVYTVEEAARQRDVVMQEMVKCILLREPRGRYIMACVRGDMRVDHRAGAISWPACAAICASTTAPCAAPWTTL